MKKQQVGQPSIESYMKKKEKSNTISSTLPKQIIEKSNKKDNGRMQIQYNSQLCTIFNMIAPQDLFTYKSAIQRLNKLQLNYSKSQTINFIHQQINLTQVNLKAEIKDMDNLTAIDSQIFWKQCVPFMLQTIINTSLKRIPILVQNENKLVILTKKEVFTILCHMFFCTLPQQFQCERVNFYYLYTSKEQRYPKIRLEKLKCLINYFEIITLTKDINWHQQIFYQRKFMRQKLNYQDEQFMSYVNITKVNIEKYKGQFNVDFANKMLGGGVLKDGAVQQEILFIIHPELIISKIISHPLNQHQAIIIFGYSQFSEYQGYSATFRCKDKFFGEDDNLDYFNKRNNIMIAIDAMDFKNDHSSPDLQYKDYYINRQIKKAYIGFSINQFIQQDEYKKKQIITGKWGCGAFKGDRQLKFIIQWIACSLCRRNMVFVNFDADDDAQFKYIFERLKDKKINEIRRILKKYEQFRRKQDTDMKLFEYINDFYLV